MKNFYEITKTDPTALIPGSGTYRWIKQDKSQILTEENPAIRRLYIVRGYIAYPLRDAILVGIYIGIGNGLVKLVEETIKLIN